LEDGKAIRARKRFDPVECVVVGHIHYGLLIESEDGERGFVDRMYIGGAPGTPWPAVGTVLPCVVIGYTRRFNRLRVATMASYLKATAKDA